VNPAVSETVCAIRDKVADLIGPNRYRTWFAGSTEFQLDGELLDVTVANAFVGNWISANYMPHLVDAAREVIGAEPRIVVHVSKEATEPRGDGAPVEQKDAPPAPQPKEGKEAGPRRLPRTPQQTALRGELESFVVGPSNELAYSVVSALVEAPGKAFKHLVVHGGCGLGKTHLLQGICNAVQRRHPGFEWRYLSGEEFTNEFVYAVKAGRVDAFRARFRNVDLLVIDDIHFLANKKATQEEFLHTFNAIDACGKAVVLSSDRHPRSISELSEPLISRLVAAMIVEIDPPDFATRREILRRRAARMLCELPDELLEYLAQRITRNVRELEGALYKIGAVASLTKQPIGLDLARRVVEDYGGASRPPGPEEIERIVAEYFGVTSDAIRSRSRDRSVSLARATAMFLIRRNTRMSFPEIGRLLGNKQHSTVIMATRRIDDALKDDQMLIWRSPRGVQEIPARQVIEDLEREFTPRGGE